MRALAIVNTIAPVPLAHLPFRAGRSVFEIALASARSLPAVERVVVLTASGSTELAAAAAAAGAQVIDRGDWSAATLFAQAQTAADGFDHVYHVYGDAPYLDGVVAAKMVESHLRYHADYTFADGYPLGLCPEILRYPVLAPLARLAQDHKGTLARDIVFQIVQKDINAFDLETELSPVDLRPLRLTLAADTRRNLSLLQRLEARGVRSAGDVTRIVTEEPAILRTHPAYANVQIVEGCPQLCSYCPYPATILKAKGVDRPGKIDEMPADRFRFILDRLTEYCGDITVSVSLWGEPSLHSAIADLAAGALGRPGVTFHVETSGVGWSRDDIDRIAAAGGAPVWIVSLDAWSPETYTRLRGPGFAEALQTAEYLRGLFPETTYLQAVRMRGGEEDTESFFRGWKERGARTIIQKYDSFAGLLPDRKVSDLSPVKRNPCWHLKRDLVVELDGRVPMCRETPGRGETLGNVFTESLETIWARGEEAYRAHLAERYPEVCRTCDEYYTYNA